MTDASSIVLMPTVELTSCTFFKKINGNLSNCATICFDKKEDNLFSLNINNFNEEKKIYTCTCTSNKYTCIFIKVHVH